MPIVNFCGVLFFKGDHRILKITTIKVCLLIEIRHNILIQCHRNCIEVKKIQ